MTPEYAFDYEAGRRLLRITIRGLWAPETVERYRRALDQAAAEIRAAGVTRDELLVLVDTRDAPVQQQEVVAEYRDKLGTDGIVPKRLATIVSSALVRRQVERAGVATQRLFADEAEALDWLLSPELPA